MAGVELARRGKAIPIGSLTQLATVRIGKRQESKFVPIKELVPLAGLDDIAFAAWDIIEEDAYQVALRSGVLSAAHLTEVADFLKTIKPMPGVHDPESVRRLTATHTIQAKSKREQAEILRENIRTAMREAGATRAAMVMLTSTEVYRAPEPVHASLEAFEKGLDANDPAITPFQLYAYASLKEKVPFANGTPNATVGLPALEELALKEGVAIAGRDLKTGQTMVKTVLAPMIKARMLGLRGWFSTNILGNRDGEVLDDPAAFRSKEITKTGVLDTILQPDLYPQLYGDTYHKVRINYYPPRGDEKEGWDNIDITGWLGYPMQIKVDFLCRDSILAAPLVLDLALLLDLGQRAGQRGIQEWLSFYFKEPMVTKGHIPEHDLFIQQMKLKNTLRLLAGEEPISHTEDDTELTLA
jgi:myo-inositol-1-phosphate synthase